MSIGHLARRFFGSLNVGPLSTADNDWVRSNLSPGETALWDVMGNADQAHAVRVARSTVASLGGACDHAVIAAALLHDIGKLESGLGTYGRVAATVAGKLGVRSGRVGIYLDHHVLGAKMLANAGSDPLTVAWAREHELPRSEWTIDPVVAAALYAADDE